MIMQIEAHYDRGKWILGTKDPCAQDLIPQRASTVPPAHIRELIRGNYVSLLLSPHMLKKMSLISFHTI